MEKTSVKDAARSDRKKTMVTARNIKRIKDFISQDAKYTHQDIVRILKFSKGTVHNILMKHLKLRMITGEIPHPLNDEKKRQCEKCA